MEGLDVFLLIFFGLKLLKFLTVAKTILERNVAKEVGKFGLPGFVGFLGLYPFIYLLLCGFPELCAEIKK